MIGFDQKLAVKVVEHAVTVIPNFSNDWRECLFSFRKIAEKDGVAFQSFTAFGNGENRKALVFGDADALKALRVFFVFVNQLIV